MRHTTATTLHFTFAASFALACAGNTWTQPPSTNDPRKQVMVQFTDATVHPETARVLEGGNVVWINYASSMDAAVVFPESVKSGFTCDQLRPLFEKTADGYQSIPIRRDREDVMLPCPLKPGEYAYEIWIFEGGMGTLGEGEPGAKIPAKIVVEPAP